MLFKRFILLSLFWSLCSILYAQDSIQPVEVPPIVAKEQRQNRSYLDKGHYDSVAYMKVLPSLDTSAYTTMKGKYSGAEFHYEGEDPDKENIFQRALSRISKWLSNLIPSTSLFNASETFYKVLAAVAMLVFLFILYKVLFTGKRLLGPSDEEGERADTLRFIEKNLLDVDLEHFIEKAKQSADYALAIRYLNLLNIQLLAQKGHILWKPSKTNQELLGEIKDSALRSEFEQNVAIFNRAWFSGMHVDATQYAVYAARFLHFQSKWK